MRTAITIRAPLAANSRAVTAPRPLLAPVMMTVRPANDGRSAAVQFVMPEQYRRRTPAAGSWVEIGARL
ncbi:heme-binding protein [Mycobacterium alsense]|uniref:heme-binding protein n=1 Tax=Mycobacterium alsense TaxID=324058 RepID=UPI001F0A6501|nr:heme-binding protein [Mycobacterium alsense]